jgi:hypothetical protein
MLTDAAQLWSAPVLNEAFGWLWIGMGFTTGICLGLGFQREDFLGGYASWRRRMVRLGHVAFYALGLLNILFAFSLPRFGLGHQWALLISWCFILGAIGMPACCFLCAWRKSLARAFPFPVLLLLTGGTIMWIGMWIGMFSGGAQ